MTNKVVLIGAGLMGGAMLEGILYGGVAASDVTIVEPNSARRADLVDALGVNESVEVAPACRGAEVVLVAVKPALVTGVLDQIAPQLSDPAMGGAVVVSIAAGVSLATLQAHVPDGVAVIRAMPNIPATVGKGMTVLSPGAHCTPQQLMIIKKLLAGTGQVLQLDEHHMDSVTAISGSGPAYVFYVAEAMIESAVGLGLPRSFATTLVLQTLTGASAMLATGEHPSILRENVTSPGGTTAAALHSLDSSAVRAAFTQAMKAAAQRSAELAG